MRLWYVQKSTLISIQLTDDKYICNRKKMGFLVKDEFMVWLSIYFQTWPRLKGVTVK